MLAMENGSTLEDEDRVRCLHELALCSLSQGDGRGAVASAQAALDLLKHGEEMGWKLEAALGMGHHTLQVPLGRMRVRSFHCQLHSPFPSHCWLHAELTGVEAQRAQGCQYSS